jgi:transposase
VNLLSCLLPDTCHVRLETWSLEPAQSAITITLHARQPSPPCPLCGRRARRVHSRYERTLADLPWGEYAATIRLKIRRLFCDNARCERRIFAERVPGVAAPRARKTTRLTGRLTAVGLALGGAAGARLSRRLGLTTSRNTLLRLIRRAPLPFIATPAALGVDDWALRKQHTYGTVLVDLDQRRPVALLPDREAGTLATWLREHPGVQVISRDRAGAYAKGARHGAPGAVQVADRFHLLQNLAEMLEVVFTAHARHLRAAGQASRVSAIAGQGSVPIPPAEPQTKTRLLAADRRERRVAVHREVWSLRRQGWSGEAIAHHLGVGRSTVFRYLRHEDFPERKGRRDGGRSLLDRWRQIVLDHWNSGRRNGRWLFGMLQQRHDYRGSYATLARYLQRLRAAQGDVAAHTPAGRTQGVLTVTPRRVLTPRTAAWLVLCRAEKRSVEDKALLAELRQNAPELDEAVALAEAFTGLIRDQAPDRLDPWLQRAADSAVRQLRRFAKHLSADYDAVRAAVELAWSNGLVEGLINRLKTLKRQMYGRAGLDLLRRRFLLAA